MTYRIALPSRNADTMIEFGFCFVSSSNRLRMSGWGNIFRIKTTHQSIECKIIVLASRIAQANYFIFYALVRCLNPENFSAFS